jgi:hypothetical protein
VAYPYGGRHQRVLQSFGVLDAREQQIDRLVSPASRSVMTIALISGSVIASQVCQQRCRFMKAVVCRAFGPPESLTLEDVPDPQPGDGFA